MDTDSAVYSGEKSDDKNKLIIATLLLLSLIVIACWFMFEQSNNSNTNNNASEQQPVQATATYTPMPNAQSNVAAKIDLPNMTEPDQKNLVMVKQTAFNNSLPKVTPVPTNAQITAKIVQMMNTPANKSTTSVEKNNVSTNQTTTLTDAGDSWLTITVHPGQSLAQIFNNLGLTPENLQQVMASGKLAKRLNTIQPGKDLKIQLTSDGQLAALQYPINDEDTLVITQQQNNSYHAQVIQPQLTPHLAFTSGTIHHSLLHASHRARLNSKLIYQLADIFDWNTSFIKNIRPGDSYNIIYEQYYSGNKKVRDGAIIAASFMSQGKLYQALRFDDADGNAHYFTPEGQSLQKAFLRAPIKYIRVSSPFNLHRMHPILHVVRPHLGVDLAAPTGTPIKATADGTIIYHGWEHGYGRTIVINNGHHYSTLFAHMSKFVPGLHTGSKVKEGQRIGYVGQSGMATGPHLHYEVRINGKHYDPMKVKLPQAAPIDKTYMTTFLPYAATMMAALDSINYADNTFKQQMANAEDA